MALSGTIADWSFADILQVISTQRKSGTLKLENSSESLALTVLDGRIVKADRDDPSRAAGFLRFLVDTGRVDPASARSMVGFYREAGEKDDPIAMLQQSGLMDGERLAGAFQAYVQELIFDVLQWQEGSYEFVAHPVTPSHASLSLSTEGLLIEGMRRIDEWVRIARVVQPRAVFGPVAGTQPFSNMPKRERALLRLIDGVQDVHSLTQLAPLTEFEMGEAMMNLYQWKLIEVATDGTADMEVVDLGVEDLEEESKLARLARAVSLVLLVIASISFGLVTNDSDWAAPAAPDRSRDQQIVSFALELYHIEHGRYPQGLSALSESGLSIGRARYGLVYRPLDDGAAYALIEEGADRAWHLKLASWFGD